MAYNASNEQSVVVAQIQKNNKGDVISIRKLSRDNFKTASLDVRTLEMGADGELKFTQHGFRVNVELGSEIALGILKCLDTAELMDFTAIAERLIRGEDPDETNEDSEESEEEE